MANGIARSPRCHQIRKCPTIPFNSIPLLPEDIFERLTNFTTHLHGGTEDLDPTIDPATRVETPEVSA